MPCPGLRPWNCWKDAFGWAGFNFLPLSTLFFTWGVSHDSWHPSKSWWRSVGDNRRRTAAMVCWGLRKSTRNHKEGNNNSNKCVGSWITDWVAKEDTIQMHPASDGWQVFVFTHAPILGSALRVLQELHVLNGCCWLNHSDGASQMLSRAASLISAASETVTQWHTCRMLQMESVFTRW